MEWVKVDKLGDQVFLLSYYWSFFLPWSRWMNRRSTSTWKHYFEAKMYFLCHKWTSGRTATSCCQEPLSWLTKTFVYYLTKSFVWCFEVDNGFGDCFINLLIVKTYIFNDHKIILWSFFLSLLIPSRYK